MTAHPSSEKYHANFPGKKAFATILILQTEWKTYSMAG